MTDPPHDRVAWRRFRKLWAATATSNLADGVLQAATPLVALTLTRDPVAITAVTAIQYLPWLLLSIPMGTLADRADRVLLLRVAGAARAVGVGLLAVGLATGHVHIVMLYGLSFLFGLAETLYDNTSSALVPSTVADHQLERANGRLQATYTVANSFVGPPLGGAVFGLALAAPFALGAMGYAVAFALMLLLPTARRKRQRIRARRRGETVEQGVRDVPGGPARAASSFATDLREGVRGFTGSPMLVALCVLLGVGNLVSAATYSLLSLTVVERLGATAATYGFVLAGGAVGAFLAGVYGDRVGALTRPGTTLLWTTVVSGLATASLGRAGHPVVLSALMALDGFVVITQSVVSVSTRARLIPLTCWDVSPLSSVRCRPAPRPWARSSAACRPVWWASPGPSTSGARSWSSWAPRSCARSATTASPRPCQPRPRRPGAHRPRPRPSTMLIA
ncbi:MFS transporter [Streptomyces sp. MST-110588]|uniref:MFS transporter n=1 Tax=Streptomyces sp. MST-110588 TaxID=2833628 RepID=UPI001F5C2AAE|nr:MFS transporter [Streptomyces sp. MST-110588]UNO38439.1 MFS transporter [Streptomyces sp. MST-110588]